MHNVPLNLLGAVSSVPRHRFCKTTEVVSGAVESASHLPSGRELQGSRLVLENGQARIDSLGHFRKLLIPANVKSVGIS